MRKVRQSCNGILEKHRNISSGLNDSSKTTRRVNCYTGVRGSTLNVKQLLVDHFVVAFIPFISHKNVVEVVKTDNHVNIIWSGDYIGCNNG